MSNGRTHNHFVEVAKETALAIWIVLAHTLVACLLLALSLLTHKAMHYAQPSGEPLKIYGVTLLYVIEGGELLLAIVIMFTGVCSALIIITVRLWHHLKI